MRASASVLIHDGSMLAAESTVPRMTTAGTVTPMGESPVTSAKWSTIWSTTSATPSGVAGLGVRIFNRFPARSPAFRSTGAPLMPLPPMSMPRGLPCLAMVRTSLSRTWSWGVSWWCGGTRWCRCGEEDDVGGRPRSGGVRGEGEDLVSVVGDEDRVLELGRAPAVTGDDGPPVVPHVPLGGPEVEHRLDGEGHAGLDDGLVVRSGVVVRHDEAGVELEPDAVSGEVAHDAVAEPLRVALDDAADDVDLAARAGGSDAAHHRLVRAFDEQAGLLVDVADEVGRVGVAVDAVDVGRDVDVDDVAVLERPRVGDAVADDLVDARAHGLREALVAEGRGVGAVVEHVLVGDRVELVGRDTGSDGLRGLDHGRGRDPRRDAHLLHGLGVLDAQVAVLARVGHVDVVGPLDRGGHRSSRTEAVC